MSFSDWNAGIAEFSMRPDQGFVCLSTTVDDLSYTPSEEERYRDAEQVSITGRRSWKTLKGKGEAVWPPLVEAALLEALEAYQPDSVGFKATKNLGRFPMRNRFISDYILEATGKRRTPKQVGSRLQQLRDTCKDERILMLISRRGSYDTSYNDNVSEYSSQASPCPSPDFQSSVSRHSMGPEPSSPPQSSQSYMYSSLQAEHSMQSTHQYAQWPVMAAPISNYEYYQQSNNRADAFELAPTYQQASTSSMDEVTYHAPRAMQAIPKYLTDSFGPAYVPTTNWMQPATTSYTQNYTQSYH